MILLGNNLINAGAATLTAVITERLFGEGELALALGTRRDHVRDPRVLRDHAEGRRRGARRPHRAARRAIVLAPMLQGRHARRLVRQPVRAGRCSSCCASGRTSDAGATLTQEELRSLVLEGQYFRGKHRAMLANLLDLEAVTVDDVMTPRNQIHALDLADEAGAARASSSRRRTTRGCRSTRTRSTTSSASCT